MKSETKRLLDNIIGSLNEIRHTIDVVKRDNGSYFYCLYDHIGNHQGSYNTLDELKSKIDKIAEYHKKYYDNVEEAKYLMEKGAGFKLFNTSIPVPVPCVD